MGPYPTIRIFAIKIEEAQHALMQASRSVKSFRLACWHGENSASLIMFRPSDCRSPGHACRLQVIPTARARGGRR